MKVQCLPLDNWVGERCYALGKIDIEGAEPLAFHGAEGMLRTGNPPVWIMEIAGYSKCYGMRTDELVDYLGVRGYDCFVYDHKARRLIATEHPWEQNLQNVLMVSRARFVEVCVRLNAA